MRTFMILAALLAAGAVQAQTQIWDYSSTVTGTQLVLLPGTSGPVDELPLASESYSSTVYGTVVLIGSGPTQSLTYNFTVTDPAMEFQLQGTEVPANCGPCGSGFGWVTPVTSANGAVTGFDVDVSNFPESYNNVWNELSIVNGVAMLQYLANTSAGTCSTAQLTDFSLTSDQGTYAGGQVNDCAVSAMSTVASPWIDPPAPAAAPELAPSPAIAALTLLAGLALVLKSRRRMA